MPWNEDGADGASSTMATMRKRFANPGSAWKAGRWPERAIPPSPSNTPRYIRLSGKLGMEFRHTLVRENQHDEHGVQRSDDDPAVGRGPMRHGGQGQQQEANILRDPRTPAHHPTLPPGPGAAQRVGHLTSGPSADERRRAWEEPGLPARVVAVNPGGDTSPERIPVADICLFGDVQLVTLANGEVQISLTNEVRRRGLVGVREQRGDRERHSSPSPARRIQARGEVAVETEEPAAVGEAVEHPAHAGRGASQPRKLSIDAVQEVRRDEEQHARRVDPGTAIPEEVTGENAEYQTRESHCVGGDARGQQSGCHTPTDRPEEAPIGPLFYD